MISVDILGLTVTIPEQATLNVVACCDDPGTKPEPLGPTKPDGCGFLVAEPLRLPLEGPVFKITTALERGAPLGLGLDPRFRLRINVTGPLPVPWADEERLRNERTDNRPLG